MQAKLFLLSALLCLTGTTYAQDDNFVTISSTPKNVGDFGNEGTPWDFRHSEIGVNIAPLAVEVLADTTTNRAIPCRTNSPMKWTLTASTLAGPTTTL